jgi:two-component system, NarL family, nitrate/nitrite response regulator NarL
MTNDNQGSRAIQVAVVAPAMLAWGLERMLHGERPRLVHAGSAGSLAQAEGLLRQPGVDVTIVDLDGGYDAEAVAEVKGWSRSALVALTSSDDRAMLDRMVVAGVRGLVRKSDTPAALAKAIEKVHEGELWIDRSAAGRIFMELARQHSMRDNDPERLKIATLTARERQTILAVASDSAAPGKVIARRMCISEHTLRNHLSAIYAKLGLANRLDLYAFATRHRLDKP